MDQLSVDRLSADLVALDNHPGLEHMRRYPPTGVTARRWSVIEPVLAQLWVDIASATELTRIRGDFLKAKEFLDAVDEINTTVAKGLAPLLKRLDDAGTAVLQEVTDLLTLSASDPLSLKTDDVERRMAAIAELTALQENWPEAVAATAVQLDALRDAVRHASQTRQRATQNVLTGPLPVSTDIEPELRAELESMTAPDPTALRELQRRVATALEHVHQDERLAHGLLDRRDELQGRLKVYEAKATRLGLADDPDLVSSRRIAAGLLSRRPCDLRAVTQAVVDYQQLVSAKREKTR